MSGRLRVVEVARRKSAFRDAAIGRCIRHRAGIRQAANGMGHEYEERVDGQDQINARFVMFPRVVSVGGAARLDNSGVKARGLVGRILASCTKYSATGSPGLRANRLPKASLVHRWLSCARRLMRSYPFCVTLPPAVKWAPRSWMRTSRCSRILVWCTVSRSPLPSAAPGLRFTQNREVLCVG